MELDQIDYRILAILQEDSRTPLNKLARKARISVPTARQRIKRLLKQEIIKRFTIALNPVKVTGYYEAFISINAKPSELEPIVSELINYDNVVGIYRTIGENNLIIRLSMQSYYELDKFILERLSTLNGVQKVSISIIVGVIKDEPALKLKPGLGIKAYCVVCGKEIVDKPLKLKLNDIEYHLCCKSCLTMFEKRAVFGKVT